MSAYESNRFSIKAVMIGDSAVGKTSIVSKFITGSTEQTAKPTIGASHHRKVMKIDGREVDFFIWDTAGQEQFHSLIPLYTRSAAIAIIVCAADSQESIDHIKVWVDLLKETCDVFPPVILAINKTDLKQPSDELLVELHEKFQSIFSVSALTGEGIEELFNQSLWAGYHFLLDQESIDSESKPKIQQRTNEHSCC